MVVTFYSFKGGVGRSMAMANIGHILAQLGYRVALCDWDLEAPGLERYVAEDKSDWEHLEAAPGLVDLLREYKEALASPADDSEEKPLDFGSYCRVGALWLRRPSSYARDVSRDGSLRLLTAGARGADYGAYAETVQNFDWSEFYEQWAGGAYMDFLKRDLSKSAARVAARELKDEDIPEGAADIVLVDSRTGVTEYGGVATNHLADLVVLLTAANDQNLQGTRRMAEALGPQLVADGEPAVPVLPVRARIETAELELLNRFRQRFDETFTNHLPLEVGHPKAFFEASEIPYVPFYSFEERVVTRTGEPKLHAAYRFIAQAIVTWGLERKLLEPRADDAVMVGVSAAQAAPGRTFGRLIVRFAHCDREWGGQIVHALAAIGLDVSTEPLGPPRAPHPEPACAMLLIGPDTPEPWVRAECEIALRRSVLHADLKLLPAVRLDADLARTPYVSRTRVARIPGGPEAVETIRFELGVRSTVESEPPNVSPFPGARAFAEDDARFFFGRESEIARVETTLQPDGANWVRIEGPAGVGKTSFLRAGVIPAVRRVFGSRTLLTPVIAEWRLLPEPLANLSLALAGATGQPPQSIEESIQSGRGSLESFAEELARASRVLVLVVDQLEEVEHLADAAVRQLDALLAAPFDAVIPFVLVTAVRREWQGVTEQRLTSLLRLPQDARVVRHQIEPMIRGQIADALAAPARLAGLEWQRGLWDRVLDEMTAEPVPLTLIAGLLHFLWLKRVERQLTFAGYREYGSPAQHLVRTLEELVQQWPGERQERARRMLLSLIRTGRVGHESRRLVARADAILAGGGDRAAAEILGELMAPPGIVRMNADDQVEIAHDAIVAQSKTLRAWIEADRARLERRDELETFIASATAGGRTSLPRGAQLAYFKEAAPLTRESRLFLDRAESQERRRRLRNWLTAAAAVLIAGTIGLFVYRSAIQANTVQARQLSLESERARDDRPVRSLLLAIQAAGVSETPESRDALERAFSASYPRTIVRQTGVLVDAQLSPDKTRLLTASTDGAAVVWDATTGQTISTMPHEQPLRAALFLPDGRVATLTGERCAIWNPAGQSVNQFRRDNAEFIQLAANRDGTLVAAADLKGSVPVWDLPNGQTRSLQASGATTVAFTPDNTVIVTTVDGDIVNEDPRSGRARGRAAHLLGVSPYSAALSEDGAWLAAGGTDGALILSLLDDAATPIALEESKMNRVSALFLSRDGRWAVGKISEVVYVWDTMAGSVTARIRPDGLQPSQQPGGFETVALSPDGSTIATAMSAGTVHLWDRETAAPIRTLRYHSGFVSQLRFSADGTLLVTAGDDGAAVWDLAAKNVDLGTLSFAQLREAAEALVPAGLTPDSRRAIVER